MRGVPLAVCAIVLAGGFPLSAHPLAQWHQRLSLPSGSPGFGDVTWGDGRFVAVGSGIVAISTNGVDWGVHDTGVPGFYGAVAHGSGRFVAVGLDGLAISSTDGTNWSQQVVDTTSAFDLFNLCYGNGLFVATGEFGRILTSPDGLAWSSQFSGVTFHLYDLTYGRGLFLIPLVSGTNLLSADGIQWQRQASGTSNNLYTVGFGGDRFLSVDTRLRTWTSPDATNWTFHGNITGIRPPEVGWGNGHFLVLANPAPEYSGIAGPWTRSGTNIVARSVAFGNGTFVITAGPSIYQSDPVIHLGMSEPGALSLSGPPGNYVIEAVDALAGVVSWQSLTNLPLTSSPRFWSDTTPNAPGRLYRAILQP